MKVRIIIGISVLTLGCASAGMILWQRACERAVAEDHAVWIARVFDKEMTIEEACAAASKASGKQIASSEWDLEKEPYFARGPIIRGEQICVLQNKVIVWDKVEEQISPIRSN